MTTTANIADIINFIDKFMCFANDNIQNYSYKSVTTAFAEQRLRHRFSNTVLYRIVKNNWH